MISFEPDKEEFERLEKASSENVIYFNSALYNMKSRIPLYLTQSRGCSSIFRPNREFLDQFPDSNRFDIVQCVEVDTDTLDNQLDIYEIDDIDFIKIDVQGCELAVLEGAVDTLNNRHVFGLEVEVEFAPMYEKQPLFSDIDKFLTNLGFELFDLRPYYWKRTAGKDYGGSKGQLIFADALYLRSPQHIDRALPGSDEIENDLSQMKVLKAVSICILYGYLDYAFELFQKHRMLFTESEATFFKRKMEKHISLSKTMPNFFGRGKLADFFKTIYNILKPTHEWADSPMRLGNID